MPDDLVATVNLILNAGGVVVFLGALLSGYVFTRPSVTAIIAEKDARIDDLTKRSERLDDKVSELTSALKESVDANKRLAVIEEIRLQLGKDK